MNRIARLFVALSLTAAFSIVLAPAAFAQEAEEVCPGIFLDDPLFEGGNLIIGTDDRDVLTGTDGFDVIIGNPPYQLDDGGYGTSAAPIYQLFVEKALDLDPRYAVFVTPSRWMAGGKGLDKYRARILSDKRMRAIVDYPKLYEGFPGVKIRGGISYFL